ncbi:hypothetical protein CGLO_15537 [Colletotrichum gloeosporioides Cg-14]|uniref:Uncharacterized protein n=1 Tax=Colletotrichum gloeosporioides (strain Cg-14) TaxID=1237896 RepID=T0JYS5_COLGC|nr:hypothetical protein CGLO_15537 [Colletotrichum gloeosporioides Cg-14]
MEFDWLYNSLTVFL